MRLVAGWKQAWRWFSVHALILAGAIPVVWASLPDDMKASIPPDVLATITGVVAALGVIGRLFVQPRHTDHDESGPSL